MGNPFILVHGMHPACGRELLAAHVPGLRAWRRR
jgi:hypothetical protein